MTFYMYFMFYWICVYCFVHVKDETEIKNNLNIGGISVWFCCVYLYLNSIVTAEWSGSLDLTPNSLYNGPLLAVNQSMLQKLK